MDIRAYNREAWNRQVEEGNEWTLPVSSEVIAAARKGQWQIVLTPIKPVPQAWFPELAGLDTIVSLARRSAWHPQAANKRRCWLLLEEK